MEDALAFVPPASNDNNSLENRLVTIVQHLIMKERQQMETEEAHKKVNIHLCSHVLDVFCILKKTRALRHAMHAICIPTRRIQCSPQCNIW